LSNSPLNTFKTCCCSLDSLLSSMFCNSFNAFSYLVAFSLISTLACLTPLLSSSMILSVLLLNLAFLVLSSNCLLKSLMLWLLSNALLM
ncbi:hypothetical protein, partial [Helicobacter pylori]|uniref:hypothetical protein n=1 Tax=Helicobacter pylori TaxID=210 RepID=UPI0031016CE3